MSREEKLTHRLWAKAPQWAGQHRLAIHADLDGALVALLAAENVAQAIKKGVGPAAAGVGPPQRPPPPPPPPAQMPLPPPVRGGPPGGVIVINRTECQLPLARVRVSHSAREI